MRDHCSRFSIERELTKAHTEFAVTQTSVTPKCVTSSVYSCSSQTVPYGLPEVTPLYGRSSCTPQINRVHYATSQRKETCSLQRMT
jgi:hypothetical protein